MYKKGPILQRQTNGSADTQKPGGVPMSRKGRGETEARKWSMLKVREVVPEPALSQKSDAP